MNFLPATATQMKWRNKMSFRIAVFWGIEPSHKTANKRAMEWYLFFARKICKAPISLHKYEWFIRTIMFHEHKAIRTDFLRHRFDHVKCWMNKLKSSAQKYYCHAEFVVLDETLHKFCAFYNLNFKVYLKDKQGNHYILCISWCDRLLCFLGNTLPYPTN